jgi:hypothetical protein
VLAPITASDTGGVAARDVRSVLRALADARDGAFYALWIELTRRWPEPTPSIGFRIFRMADTDNAHVVVSVGGTSPNGVEALWSVSVVASDEELTLEGQLEVADGDNWSSIYRDERVVSDPSLAAESILALASAVCSQRDLLRETPPATDERNP